MGITYRKEEKLLRWFTGWKEIAYLKLEISGLACQVEFPSDWHEEKLGWFTFGLGLFRMGLAFPWKWVVPDNYQCSGPQYGFSFFDDSLHLSWGKCNGVANDPSKFIQMPWGWRFVEHKILSDKETHDYTCQLKSGKIQKRTATIFKQSREWKRPWIPRRLYIETIDIEFDGEVGECTGSWKGGTIGCSYELLPEESLLKCLRRMEGNRKF